jgi:hypothetical protein
MYRAYTRKNMAQQFVATTGVGYYRFECELERYRLLAGWHHFPNYCPGGAECTVHCHLRPPSLWNCTRGRFVS